MARYMDRGHLLNIIIALEYGDFGGIRIHGYIQNQKTAILQYENEWYSMWDNGGEIGVEKLNSNNPRYAPMTNFGSPLNAATMAYRITQILKDKEIDYDFKYENAESEAFLNEYGCKELMYEHFSFKGADENGKTIDQKAKEILERTDNGSDIFPPNLKLIELAMKQMLNEDGFREFDKLYDQVMLGEHSKPHFDIVKTKFYGDGYTSSMEDPDEYFRDTDEPVENKYNKNAQGHTFLSKKESLKGKVYNMSGDVIKEYDIASANQDMEDEDEDEL